MATFLELVNDTKRECGLEGVAVLSFGAASELDQKIIRWVKDSWRDIQTAQTWSFLKAFTTLSTVAGQRAIDRPADVVEFDRGFALINGRPAQWVRWENMRGLDATQLNVPTMIAEFGGSLFFSPTPDAAYTVELESSLIAKEINLETDVPQGIHADLHQIIVWAAVMRYCAHDEAATLYQKASQNYQQLFAVMVQRYLQDEYTIASEVLA